MIISDIGFLLRTMLSFENTLMRFADTRKTLSEDFKSPSASLGIFSLSETFKTVFANTDA